MPTTISTTSACTGGARPRPQYPDGYLGTINTRREDRLLDGLKKRQTNRPYTRGIHKGERIDCTGLLLASRVQPVVGLETPSSRGASSLLLASVNTWSTSGTRLIARSALVVSRSVPGTRTVVVQNAPQNPDRIPVLRSQAPPWATGVRGNPGMAVPYPGR